MSGDANFSIKRTSLTVGGFNQPYVARSLIELPGNAEKGLSQRFLWMFPKPVYAHFDTLEPPDDTFLEKIGRKIVINWPYLCFVVWTYTVVKIWWLFSIHHNHDLSQNTTKVAWLHLYTHHHAVRTLSKLWRPSLPGKELEVRILEMPDRSQLGTFVTKYDSIQDNLDTLAAMDDLLAGGEDGDQSC